MRADRPSLPERSESDEVTVPSLDSRPQAAQDDAVSQVAPDVGADPLLPEWSIHAADLQGYEGTASDLLRYHRGHAPLRPIRRASLKMIHAAAVFGFGRLATASRTAAERYPNLTYLAKLGLFDEPDVLSAFDDWLSKTNARLRDTAAVSMLAERMPPASAKPGASRSGGLRS